MRLGLSRDLGFSDEDRSENLRRASETAKLFNNSGLICILSMIAPNEDARSKSAKVVGEERFILVHLNAPAEICAERNRATDGDEAEESALHFQVPENPDLVLDTSQLSTSECVDKILEMLESKNLVV